MSWINDRIKEIRKRGWKIDQKVLEKYKIHPPRVSTGLRGEVDPLELDAPDVDISLDEGGND